MSGYESAWIELTNVVNNGGAVGTSEVMVNRRDHTKSKNAALRSRISVASRLAPPLRSRTTLPGLAVPAKKGREGKSEDWSQALPEAEHC